MFLKRCKLLAWDLKELNLVSDLSKLPVWPWAKHQVPLVSAFNDKSLSRKSCELISGDSWSGILQLNVIKRLLCHQNPNFQWACTFFWTSKACCHVGIVVDKLRELSSNSPDTSTNWWWLRFTLTRGYEFLLDESSDLWHVSCPVNTEWCWVGPWASERPLAALL